jgi:hypothetical protein
MFSWLMYYSIVVDPNECKGLAVKHCTGSLPRPLQISLTWVRTACQVRSVEVHPKKENKQNGSL